MTRRNLTRILLSLCLFFQGAFASGRSFAVIIGIERYESFPGSLSFPRFEHAAGDAREVAEKLRASLGFAEEDVIFLVDEQATRKAIETALLEVIPKEKGIRGEDSLFVFFEGNAIQRKNEAENREECVIIPYDGDQRRLSETAIPAWNLLVDVSTAVPAKNVLFALNLSCPELGSRVTSGRSGLMVSLTKTARQVIVLQEKLEESGASGRRTAYTDLLLKGLSSEADQNRDGLVTAAELATFMNENRLTGPDRAPAPVILGHIPVESDNARGDFAFVIGSRKEGPGDKGSPIVDKDSFRRGSAGSPPFREKPARPKLGKHEKGPAISVDATNVFVGRVEEGEIILCEYNVRNVGKQALKIFSVEPG